jgi:mannose-1-phosphate guanylyltransferase
MRAVVLVGGEGTRLRPLTFSLPKQMLPVAGRPMIERVVEYLGSHGIDEVVLSLGYRPDAFLAAYPDGHCGHVRLRYAVESQPLDTAGAIAFAADEAGINETFLVVNGDVLTDLDISALVEFHRSSAAEATIALTPVEDPSAFGVVPVDGSGRVIAFIEKPARHEAPTNMINAGTYVFEPSVLDRIPRGQRVSVERKVFPDIVADGRLFAVGSAAAWLDAGTPAKYLEANLAYAARESHDLRHHESHIDAEAKVSHSVLGLGARVDAGAVVEGSVLFGGVWVKAGATVRDSVLAQNVIVGEGAEVDALSVLGDGWEVPAGERLSQARLPADRG